VTDAHDCEKVPSFRAKGQREAMKSFALGDSGPAALDGPIGQPLTFPSPVPGLDIVREDCTRECWDVVHSASGIPVILDLAGQATAEIVAEELAWLLGWPASAPEIADAAGLLCCVEPAAERIAKLYGGVSLREIAVYRP
jgi:hypothetical protein